MGQFFGIVFDEMTSNGFKPKLQKMDNEACVALKNPLRTDNYTAYRILNETIKQKH
jgi:hypothetical protein